MKNTLLLLPLVATLSACISTGEGSSDVLVEDKSNRSSKVDAIVREASKFDWSDSIAPSDNTTGFSPTSLEAKAITELKANKVKFTLYFSYDEFDIGEATTQDIIKHANFMRDNLNVKLRLEGHADERGTREYNLALGENRAISVKEVLSLYEGLESRVQVVSYGEENPISETHDEAAWAKDRRVEFIYELK